jgi:hypothetical protein
MDSSVREGDSRARYEAITNRNRARLCELHAMASKSSWAKYYHSIRSRALSATLLNAFRTSILAPFGNGPLDPTLVREQIAAAMTEALTDPSETRAARAFEYAVYEVRRLSGLIDPARRAAYPSSATDPESNLSEFKDRGHPASMAP